jgi:NAD(P)-dependent dehydrogenase (short-subunit alcohol dehydrogenase family)
VCSIKKGNVAVITGAASGVGLAMARNLAEQGMRIVLADQNQDALDDVVKQFKADDVVAVKTDVRCAVPSKPSHLDCMCPCTALQPTWKTSAPKPSTSSAEVRLVGSDYRRPRGDCARTVDLLHLNAGISLPTSSYTDLPNWHAILAVNLFGVVNGLAAFVPKMLKGRKDPGAIVITGSKQSVVPVRVESSSDIQQGHHFSARCARAL